VKKLIVISAPSGAGKTSIVHYLLKNREDISFSISACSRKKRKEEQHAKDYYFCKINDFKNKIKENAFLEWEEVYAGQYYGTLKSEIERIWSEGKSVIVDIDVVGGLNIKEKYSEQCLSIFIMPPSIQSLRKRLEFRGSESKKNLDIRLAKAKKELSESKNFDVVILNEDFDLACKKANNVISKFISN
tara:strand:+ start:603 stop:1166 length:564 start_codon:yes stop_codon:yes gene_type:complete